MSGDGMWTVDPGKPSLDVRKVDSNWYTYVVHVGGTTTIGQGNRATVYRAVEDILRRSGGRQL